MYEGIPLPMPTDDNQTATTWRMETQYLAVSTNQQENALLTAEQLAACVGPPDQAVCQEGFATTKDWSTCLATLFMHPAHMAIHACDIVTLRLPEVEQATNLRHGRWLITSRTPEFTLRIVPDGGGSSTARGTKRQLPECRACIITLACGTVVETDSLLLTADASSCNATGARRLDLNISAPLATLFSYVPLTAGSADEYEALTARRVHLFREVQARLPPATDLPAPSLDRLRLIAEPIAYNAAVTSEFDVNFAVSRDWWTQVATAAALAAVLNYLLPRGFTCLLEWHRRRRRPDEDMAAAIPLHPRATRHTPPIFITTPNATTSTTTIDTAHTTNFEPTAPGLDQAYALSPTDRLAVICASVNARLATPTARPPAYSRHGAVRI